MTAVEAKTTPPTAPSIAAPTQIVPGGVARRHGNGVAPPSNAVPPAPPEPELMRALAPSQAAKVAVETFRELQGELQTLEQAHPKSETLIDAKKNEVISAQHWAIEAATKNRDLVAAEDKPADDLRKKLRSEVDKLSHELSWNDNGPEMCVLDQDAARAESAYTAVHVRLLDAESLLEQANSTPKGRLKSAEEDLEKAKQRYFAADMKLKAAEGQPHPDPRIVVPARREFESARAKQAEALHNLEIAGEIEAYMRETVHTTEIPGGGD
jgi:hypothetical protein